jgi:site-specific DNA-methyltransferase (adenine-specific)
MTPYYADDFATIYHGDCREVLASSEHRFDLLLSDPPYPNNACHFLDGIEAAEQVLANPPASRVMAFWHQLTTPAVPLPLVARHIWHRSNTNRPDNYEAIYEFASEPERSSQVFSYPVIFPGLTGCHEATGHPTQKPERLMERLITLRKDVATVLDPFMGSGTTVVAAKRLNRQVVGCDVSEEFCEQAARRLSQEVLNFGGVA